MSHYRSGAGLLLSWMLTTLICAAACGAHAMHCGCSLSREVGLQVIEEEHDLSDGADSMVSLSCMYRTGIRDKVATSTLSSEQGLMRVPIEPIT
jgi:hypothetical protein